ncbi:restriction endonuclease subunit S [Morganella morganii]|uniref:restriction endonuclease subunit S n=1 Tax=Morganella morganii TaxID=582 RepID=UPI003EBAFFF3
MSELSYLKKLLNGVEVEWKALGEVCDFKNGFAFKSSLFKEAGLPIIRITNVDGKNISLDDVKYFDPSDYKENTASYEISKGDILIAMSGATTGKIGFYAHESPAYLNQRVGKFLPKPKILNNRYLYHYLLSKVEQIYVIAGGGAQPNLSSNALMAKIEIPILYPDNPEKSLAIQAEIVRILDTFTALTAELTAELTARKKQYNYYRDQLLSFNDGKVEWKTLGEIAGYSKARISFDKLNENNYVGVDNLLQNRAGKTLSNYLPTSGNLTKFDIGDILIGNIRPYLKKIWQSDCVGGTNGDVLVIHCSDSSVCSRYLYQVLADDAFFEYNMQHAKGAKMPRGNKEAILKYSVPVPSVTEQTRIVSILDKFDALTNSITEGLPREIELRQKQYEYYRDLLFSFPEPESVNN